MSSIREDPEHQRQDTYRHGVDLVREIVNEFGTTSSYVRQQLIRAEIALDGVEWTGDRLFIPYNDAKGKEITIVAPDRHWRWQYRG